LGPGCVKTLRGIIAPGILGSMVMRRAKKCKNSSCARHYDQIRFRFRTAWVKTRTPPRSPYFRFRQQRTIHRICSGPLRAKSTHYRIATVLSASPRLADVPDRSVLPVLTVAEPLGRYATVTLAPSKGRGWAPAAASNRATCTADQLPPRAAGMPRSSNPAAMARNDSRPAACSSLMNDSVPEAFQSLAPEGECDESEASGRGGGIGRFFYERYAGGHAHLHR
jgi:hypothetical protein